MKNIEKITKYCSKLGELFGYPYYFNWSFPTNHRDKSPRGEMLDSSYFIFRAGYYPKKEDHEPIKAPVETELLFGSCRTITDFHTQFNYMLGWGGFANTRKINSFKDIKKYMPKLKKQIENMSAGK